LGITKSKIRDFLFRMDIVFILLFIFDTGISERVPQKEIISLFLVLFSVFIWVSVEILFEKWIKKLIGGQLIDVVQIPVLLIIAFYSAGHIAGLL